MTWEAVLDVIVEVAGRELAQRIERRLAQELGGARVTVAKRRRLTRDDVDTVAPGRPAEAAVVLGVHRSTVYRAIRRPVSR